MLGFFFFADNIRIRPSFMREESGCSAELAAWLKSSIRTIKAARQEHFFFFLWLRFCEASGF